MNPLLFDRLVESMESFNPKPDTIPVSDGLQRLLCNVRKYIKDKGIVVITAKALVRSENTDCANIMSRIGELTHDGSKRQNDICIVHGKRAPDDRTLLRTLCKGKVRGEGSIVWTLNSRL